MIEFTTGRDPQLAFLALGTGEGIKVRGRKLEQPRQISLTLTQPSPFRRERWQLLRLSPQSTERQKDRIIGVLQQFGIALVRRFV